MKSQPVGIQSILATDDNSRRDDARGGSYLFAHQQLGALALGTAPTNGQIVTVVVNSTSVVFTAVTGTPTNPGDVKAPGSALDFVTNLIAALRRPDLATSTYIPISTANQPLIQYVGWAWPTSATTIVPFSFNKNANGASAPLISLNITTTVTSGTWTVKTMQLYVEDGTYYIGSTQVKFKGGSTPVVTAPVSNPRIDVLTIDTSGTLAWTTGTENASPTVPSYPLGKVPICELYNVVGETALYDTENGQGGQGYIQADVRPYTSVQAGGYSPVANGTGNVTSSTTQTIAHGLARIPVSLDLYLTAPTVDHPYGSSIGNYNGTQAVCLNFSNSGQNFIANAISGGGANASATVTWDATNFYLTWTITGSFPSTPLPYVWKIM